MLNLFIGTQYVVSPFNMYVIELSDFHCWYCMSLILSEVMHF